MFTRQSKPTCKGFKSSERVRRHHCSRKARRHNVSHLNMQSQNTTSGHAVTKYHICTCSNNSRISPHIESTQRWRTDDPIMELVKTQGGTCEISPSNSCTQKSRTAVPPLRFPAPLHQHNSRPDTRSCRRARIRRPCLRPFRTARRKARLSETR